MKYSKTFREAPLPNGSNTIIILVIPSTTFSSMSYIIPSMRHSSRSFACDNWQHYKYYFCLQFILDKSIFLLFLEHCKNSPVLRLLQWLHLLPNTLLPPRTTWLLLSFISVHSQPLNWTYYDDPWFLLRLIRPPHSDLCLYNACHHYTP